MANTSTAEIPRSVSLGKALLRRRNAAWRYLRAGPGHFLMYVFGRFRIIRSIVLWSHKLKSTVTPVSTLESLLEKIDTDEGASLLERDGLFTGLRLKPRTLQALLHVAADAACFADDDFQKPFDFSDREAAEQRYGEKIRAGRLDSSVQSCPEMQALSTDPALLSIAGKYLGCEPVLLGSRIWWNFATGADAAQQMSLGQGFHYDLDGYKALAFFFYLTDVTATSGPHICVRGSHNKKPLKSLLSLYKGRSDAEIEQWYGKERQATVCGPAGSGFAEDIFCFHKGTHPEVGDRLILQLRYGICNYDKKNRH